MYAIIKQSHTAVGHGGLHKTYNDLKTHYANISREVIKNISESPYKALFGSDPKVGLSSSSVPRDLLPDIQTEEDLQAIFEANSVSTDNTDTETETDATMSKTDNITDTNTEPTIELETETMVIELSCVNEAGIAGSDIPPVFVFCCCFFF